MIYINVRHTVADYATWRPYFDADESRRRAAGATGINQVYRDSNDPNVVTLIMQWDNMVNAQKFYNDPMMRDVMQKAGVIGMPAVSAILLPA